MKVLGIDPAFGSTRAVPVESGQQQQWVEADSPSDVDAKIAAAIAQEVIDRNAAIAALAATVAAELPLLVPPGFLNVKDYGAVGDGVHDDGPAFTTCAIAAIALQKGVWVPAGNFQITTLATFTGDATYQQALEVRGVDGASCIICNSIGGNVFYFPNVQTVRVRDLLFIGKAGRFEDCYRALYFASCADATVEDCTFKWIGCSGESLILIENGGLRVRNCNFMGCANATALINAGGAATWSRCEVTDSRFNDIGYINGSTAGSKVGSGANQVIVDAWVLAKDCAAIIGAYSQSTLYIARCWFDENAKHPVKVANAGARLQTALVEDCQASAGIVATAGVSVFDFQKVKFLQIDRCYVNELGGGGVQRNAYEMRDVTRTSMTGSACSLGVVNANAILADGTCGTLVTNGMAAGAEAVTITATAPCVLVANP